MALDGDKVRWAEQSILKLADTLDGYIPTTGTCYRSAVPYARLNVFSISGRGTVGLPAV